MTISCHRGLYFLLILCCILSVRCDCNGRGQLVSGNEVTPPLNDATTFCLCNDTYAGDQCQFDIDSHLFGEQFNVSVASNGQYFGHFASLVPLTGFYDLYFNVESISGDECNGGTARIRYSCGGCVPEYPFQYTSMTGTKTVADYTWIISNLTTSYSIPYSEPAATSCGCNGFGNETWILEIDNTAISQSCNYNVSLTHAYACPSTTTSECSGFGTCTSALCDCNSGRGKLDCSSASKSIELYNGITYQQKISRLANDPFQGFVSLGISNRYVKISVKPYSSGGQQALAFLNIGGSGSSQLTNDSVVMRLYTRFGQPPQLNYNVEPNSYPSVFYDVSDGVFDANKNGTTMEIMHDLTTGEADTYDRLYVTVVAPGFYDVRTSQPIANEDIQFLISVALEDKYAGIIDVVLIAFFVTFMFMFCACWRCCPVPFHWMLQKIVPEIYEMKRNQEQHYVQTYQDKNVAEMAAKATAVGLYVLYQVLNKCMKQVYVDITKEKIHLPDDKTIEKVLETVRSWIENAKIPLLEMPDVGLNLSVNSIIPHILPNLPLENLNLHLKLPEATNLPDIIKHLEHHIPNIPDIELHLISLPDLLQAINKPELAKLHMDILQIKAALPAVPIPKVNPDLKAAIDAIKVAFHRFPILDAILKELEALPNVELKDLIKDIEPVALHLKSFKISEVDLSAVKFKEIEMPQFHIPDPSVAHCLQTVPFIMVGELFNAAIEFVHMIFNIAIMHAAFANFDINVPSLDELYESLSVVIGPYLSKIVYVVSVITDYIDIKKLLAKWNCGGTVTLLSPFVFLLGDIIVWIILQKDLPMYFGVKMRLDRKDKLNAVRRKIWDFMSKLMVRITISTLQLVVYSLSEAVITTSTSKKTCNDVDLASNTVGKGLAIAFYALFYLTFSFMFIGAPDWKKYEGFSTAKTVVWVCIDGLGRFMELSSGVFTDATVKSYNIIGRATRYMKEKDLQPSHLHYSLHEQVMHLIATTRNVIWVPLPLGMVFCKITEYLNQSHIFIFTKNEHLVFRQPFFIRLLSWIFHFTQIPLLLSIVLTANSSAIALLFLTLVPLYIIHIMDDFIASIIHFCQCCMCCATQLESLEQELDLRRV